MIVRMTPEDLSVVQRSWAQLRLRRAPLMIALTHRFDLVDASPIASLVRAGWLVDAVEELVGLLAAPSHLAARARALGETWPDPLTAPCFAVDGQAWLDAARACVPSWSDTTDAAWRQAWLLLSDVLAAEALSPFADTPCPGHPEGTTTPDGGPDHRAPRSPL
jgi:hypothetical protein